MNIGNSPIFRTGLRSPLLKLPSQVLTMLLPNKSNVLGRKQRAIYVPHSEAAIFLQADRNLGEFLLSFSGKSFGKSFLHFGPQASCFCPDNPLGLRPPGCSSCVTRLPSFSSETGLVGNPSPWD